MERKSTDLYKNMAIVIKDCMHTLGYDVSTNQIVNIVSNHEVCTTLMEVINVKAFSKVYGDYIINNKSFMGTFDLVSSIFSSIMEILGEAKLFNYGEGMDISLRDIQGNLYIKETTCTDKYELAAEVFSYIVNTDICREYSISIALLSAIVIINKEIGIMKVPQGFLDDIDMHYNLHNDINPVAIKAVFANAEILEELDED